MIVLATTSSKLFKYCKYSSLIIRQSFKCNIFTELEFNLNKYVVGK